MFKLKRLTATVSLAMFVTITPMQAQAAIPVIDPTAIARIAAQTAQQVQNFGSEMAMYAKQMAQEIQLFGQQMRSDFNRSVMEVGGITQVQTDTQNLYMLAELQPIAEDACKLITVNEHQAKMEAVAGGVTESAMNNYNSRNMPKAGEDPRPEFSNVPTPFEYKLALFEQLKSLDDRYSSGGGSVSVGNGNGNSSSGSIYLNPQYMFIDNMNQEEFRVATIQKELLAGPPQDPLNATNLEDDLYKQRFVEKARRQMLKSFAVYAIQDTISNRYADPASGVSKIGSVEQYLDDTIRDPEWVKRYTNTNQDPDKLTTQAQVTRALSGIEAKRLELETMSYKQMEQIKSMLAVSALINLEK